MPDGPSIAVYPTASAPGSEETPLRRLAFRGAVWTIVGFGGSQALRLGFNLIVSRLLYPDLFGVMALVFTLVTGLALFCDVGVEPAVVRDPRGMDPAFLNTAWVLQAIRGFVLAGLCCVLAWPFSVFYGDRRLLWIVPAIGVGNAVAGFNSTSLLTLKRNMEVRRLVWFELGSQVFSGMIMVVWAWLSPTISALVAAPLSWAIIRLVWSHLLVPGRRDRLGWDPAVMRELLRFGRWIWISTFLSFLALQMDRLILGKLMDWRTFGIYGLIAAIAELPRSLVFAIGGNVIYPAYARSAGLSRSELRERILRNRRPLLLAIAVPIVILTVVGDGAVRVLYDKRYAAGAWMLPVLALGIWPSALSSTVDSALVAIGQPGRVAAANVAKILFTIVGVPLGFRLAGAGGAVVAVALNDLPYYGQIAWALARERLNCRAQDLKATAALAATALLLLFIRHWLGFQSPLRGMFR